MTSKVPFLAFTRKYGWVVVVPALDGREDRVTLGFSRPGNVRITRVDTLATAPLPPVPEAAL